MPRFDFTYGDCTPTGGSFFEGEGPSCTPPLDVQQVPACALNAQVAGRAHRRVRGVPTHWDGDGLTLYTATTTITIFNDHGLTGALNIARQLRSLDGHITTTQPLPPPTRYQLEGHQRCNST
ncbi:MAG: hypothetical protein E6G56_07510 [Actinobacteria bacterium]|nr:MAG: hypothetical protein E6G56_07510 [Actinomycetota bacterium]